VSLEGAYTVRGDEEVSSLTMESEAREGAREEEEEEEEEKRRRRTERRRSRQMSTPMNRRRRYSTNP